ncbi:3'-5' exoribonuclease 1 [Eurytemora carolleeae]|uniref:3'-5' exoribonuclease 1 n=1 Tax=Eurytemora carolleeae TaxID=1294199 RepID=UPI000C76BAC8|nr:3'-5' exoribonuclease 1 [Eurytemora carolleeae]|eukprot:XP_023344113.1 3'-5' exoribonuclease 1-like [Eurytemora affinis]
MGDRECRDLVRKLQKTPKKSKKIEKDENKENLSEDMSETSESIRKTQNAHREGSALGESTPGKGARRELIKDEDSFSDPVYRDISRKNGFLNKQDLSTLKRICKDENIDSSGKKDLVTKRLKQFYKVQLLREAGLLEPSPRGFDYLVVIDFEATCEEKNSSEYPHEIIEFPAVLVDVFRCKIVTSWRRYVRPVLNPTLSEFCTSLTGITQDQVDRADDFPTVLNMFYEWLKEHRLGTDYTFSLVTDGPFDIGRFLRLSCSHHSLEVPWFATRWINLRKAFSNYYRQGGNKTRERAPGLQNMLAKLDLTFQGTPHSGLDDATNIGRVTERLLRDGATLRVNERLELGEFKQENKDKRLQQVASVSKKESEDWLNRCKIRREEYTRGNPVSACTDSTE